MCTSCLEKGWFGSQFGGRADERAVGRRALMMMMRRTKKFHRAIVVVIGGDMLEEDWRVEKSGES